MEEVINKYKGGENPKSSLINITSLPLSSLSSLPSQHHIESVRGRACVAASDLQAAEQSRKRQETSPASASYGCCRLSAMRSDLKEWKRRQQGIRSQWMAEQSRKQQETSPVSASLGFCRLSSMRSDLKDRKRRQQGIRSQWMAASN